MIFFDGNDVLLLGHFDFGDMQYLIDTTAKGDDERIEVLSSCFECYS